MIKRSLQELASVLRATGFNKEAGMVDKIESTKVAEVVSETIHTQTHSDERGTWDVYKLWELSKDLPVTMRDPDSFPEMNDWSWDEEINIKIFVEHMERVLEADLSFPIILDAEGNVMDGHHRLAKAALEGVKVRVVQFEITPEPNGPPDNS